jgi:hypothetical protein
MNCPRCAQINLPEAQLCQRCGNSLFLTVVAADAEAAEVVGSPGQIVHRTSRAAWVVLVVALLVIAGLTLPFLLKG